jgi:hypothetical protein
MLPGSSYQAPMKSRWREPIHVSATLLSGSEGKWREMVTELDSEISLRSRIHPELPFFEMRIWQKDDDGFALAILRGSGKREVWLLDFRCTSKSSAENERAIWVKTEIQVQYRLAALGLKSRSKTG